VDSKVLELAMALEVAFSDWCPLKWISFAAMKALAPACALGIATLGENPPEFSATMPPGGGEKDRDDTSEDEFW
jgi:hypothetical protein